MSLINKVEKIIYKDTVDYNIRVGDIVKVEYQLVEGTRSIRTFIGICVRKVGRVNLKYITLRNVLDGVGLEFSFFINTPNIVSIKCIRNNKGLYRGNKLYYLRDRPLSESLVKR